jgi:hypothetical protein
MSIDRQAARRRVKVVTAWAAAGAAALTAGLAFGASRNTAAKPRPTSPATRSRSGQPQVTPAPNDYGQSPDSDGSGFSPPRASASPPSAMSGGS